MIYYGYARLTGGIDIYYELSNKNVDKLFNALNEFWDENIPGIDRKELLYNQNMVFQFGVTPNRIDLLNKTEGLTFAKAWKNRKVELYKDGRKKYEVNYIGLNDLIKNKKSVGRFKDYDDLKFLSARKKLKNKQSD